MLKLIVLATAVTAKQDHYESFLQHQGAKLACVVSYDLALYDFRRLGIENVTYAIDETQSLQLSVCKMMSECNSSAFAFLRGDGTCTRVTKDEWLFWSTVTHDENTLVLNYISDSQCKPDRNYQLQYNMVCADTPQTVDARIEEECKVIATITSPNACPMFKGTSFGIFMSHWPLLISLTLICFGIQSLFYGAKRFRIIVILAFMTVSFFATMVLLSKLGFLGFLEHKYQNVSMKQHLLFGVLSLISVVVGGAGGYYIDEFFGLVFIVALNTWIVSTAFYMFLMAFTGLWQILFLTTCALLVLFMYLILNPTYQFEARVQATSCLGAYGLMRGFAMLVGGYPSEGQMYQWLYHGQNLQQTAEFYFYMTALIILYLVGQYYQGKYKPRPEDSFIKS